MRGMISRDLLLTVNTHVLTSKASILICSRICADLHCSRVRGCPGGGDGDGSSVDHFAEIIHRVIVLACLFPYTEGQIVCVSVCAREF